MCKPKKVLSYLKKRNANTICQSLIENDIILSEMNGFTRCKKKIHEDLFERRGREVMADRRGDT